MQHSSLIITSCTNHLGYDFDIPLTHQSPASSIRATRAYAALGEDSPQPVLYSSLPELTLASSREGALVKPRYRLPPNYATLHLALSQPAGCPWQMSAVGEVQGCRWSAGWINLS